MRHLGAVKPESSAFWRIAIQIVDTAESLELLVTVAFLTGERQMNRTLVAWGRPAQPDDPQATLYGSRAWTVMCRG